MKLERYPHLTSRPGVCGGVPIVKGTRTPVRSIAGYYQMGMSVDEILQSLPHLSPAQVHAALAYYFDHKAQIDRDIRRNNDIEFWKRWLKRKTAKAA
ncbi:MAG: DUF433 domain-containing protein [Verrucomicrobia subdivision 3 bacterium]|nr:DUF433 domain-containing protein [Limisphaerales bacterium]